MKLLHYEGSISIDRPMDAVFEFLANPDIDLEVLTPLEDRIVERQEVQGIGAECRTTVELAARELQYLARCTEYEPPHRLASQLEGDVEGADLRDNMTAERWGQRLVDQTLANVKTFLEQPAELRQEDDGETR
jgi:hypothetical protein